MDEIIKKIEFIKKAFPDAESIDLISQKEKTIKLAMITANLKNNDGFKLLLEKYENEIYKIDKELISTPQLFKNQEGMFIGQLLHERKKWCKEFINIFAIAEKKVEAYTKAIDEDFVRANDFNN
jgi:hypothetical protein